MFPLGVEHWKVGTGRNLVQPIKLRIPEIKNIAVRLRALRFVGLKENSPDLKLRSLNLY